MIEAGRAYVSANKLFVNGVKDLSHQCKKEEIISVSWNDMAELWQNIRPPFLTPPPKPSPQRNV